MEVVADELDPILIFCTSKSMSPFPTDNLVSGEVVPTANVVVALRNR